MAEAMRRRGLLCLPLVAGVAAAGVAPAAALATPSVKVTTTNQNVPELIRTLPISKHPWGASRVVMSLSPSQLGPLGVGDRVQGSSELEVSVTCLTDTTTCKRFGHLYRYDPHVRLKLILAGSRLARTGYSLGKAQEFGCSQTMPNRNHHCVFVTQRSRRIDDVSSLPCAPSSCHLNLVATAYNQGAKPNDLLVIGSDSDQVIDQGQGRLNAVIFRDGMQAGSPRTTHRRLVGHAPVAEHANNPQYRSIYSVRLGHLHAGDQLLVQSRSTARMSGLPYTVLNRAQLILATGPRATNRHGAHLIASAGGRVDQQNGFNCTNGPSPFRNPCPRTKLGVLKILHDPRTHPQTGTGHRIPLFLNLVVAFNAEGATSTQWHPGTDVQIGKGGLRVWRFPAAASPGGGAPSCQGKTATVWGSGKLTGGPGNDVIVGSDGSDVIAGGKGNDLICAGAGNDQVTGESGSDRIFGGDGNDRLDGGTQGDAIHGDTGDDTIIGASGADTLAGDTGSDVIWGGTDNDALDGGPERDACHGDSGTDKAAACEVLEHVP
jgi:hypothetical protein